MVVLASTAGNMAFALGAAIVSFFLIRRSRRYLAGVGKRSKVKGISAAGEGATFESRSLTNPALAAEVSRGQVQLHDTARELMGELDSKISALQALVRMANVAIEQLDSRLQDLPEYGKCEDGEGRQDTLGGQPEPAISLETAPDESTKPPPSSGS